MLFYPEGEGKIPQSIPRILYALCSIDRSPREFVRSEASEADR